MSEMFDELVIPEAPAAPASGMEVPLTDFLFFLSYFGTHLDNPALARVLDRFGLAERQTVTEAEMARVIEALADEARAGLEAIAEAKPELATFARVAGLSTAVATVAIETNR